MRRLSAQYAASHNAFGILNGDTPLTPFHQNDERHDHHHHGQKQQQPQHRPRAGVYLVVHFADRMRHVRHDAGENDQRHTITDAATVIGSLAKVRKQGFATVAEENIRGVLSVGAPIRDRTGKVLAALSVAFPKYLDSALTLQSVAPLVVAAAERVSRAVGAQPS